MIQMIMYKKTKLQLKALLVDTYNVSCSGQQFQHSFEEQHLEMDRAAAEKEDPENTSSKSNHYLSNSSLPSNSEKMGLWANRRLGNWQQTKNK